MYRIQNFPTSRRLTAMSGPIHLNSTEILSSHTMICSSHGWDIRCRKRRLKSWHGVLVGMRIVTALCQLRFKVLGELRESFVFITAEGGRGVGLWHCDLGRGFACRRVWVIVYWKAVLRGPMTETTPTPPTTILRLLDPRLLRKSKIKRSR